jgi:hypothetical protein
MRAEISRVYIIKLLNSLDEFDTEHDKLKIAEFICDLVFDSDIIYDQHGEHDNKFNEFFLEKVRQFYVFHPMQFEKYMKECEEIQEILIDETEKFREKGLDDEEPDEKLEESAEEEPNED